MLQPASPLPGKRPFLNIIHNSNMHQSMPDPAWMLGMSARIGLNGLRDFLRLFAHGAPMMKPDRRKYLLEEFMRRILALLALSFDEDKAVLDDENLDGADAIGVTIAHQLHDLFHRADDMVSCLSMLEGEDVADFAERAELQIAALIHGHFVAQETANA